MLRQPYFLYYLTCLGGFQGFVCHFEGLLYRLATARHRWGRACSARGYLVGYYNDCTSHWVVFPLYLQAEMSPEVHSEVDSCITFVQTYRNKKVNKYSHTVTMTIYQFNKTAFTLSSKETTVEEKQINKPNRDFCLGHEGVYNMPRYLFFAIFKTYSTESASTYRSIYRIISPGVSYQHVRESSLFWLFLSFKQPSV